MPKTIVGVERAAEGKLLLEPRLWGTWKSDRKKTFEHVHLPKATPAGLRKLRSIFGKLTVTWGRSTKSWHFSGKRFLGRFPNDETPTVTRYTVLARSRDHVVLVLAEDSLLAEQTGGIMGSETLVTIEFDSNGYWVSSPLMVFKEFFRRMPDGKAVARKRK